MQAPPPYTFSGLASFPEHDLALKSGALSGKHGKSPTNQARPYFRDAMNAYIEKRYAEATDLLEQAAKAEPNAPDVNFFLGVCRLLEAKPADSVTPLQNAFADQKSPWAQAAHFYLAKACIQTGDQLNDGACYSPHWLCQSELDWCAIRNGEGLRRSACHAGKLGVRRVGIRSLLRSTRAIDPR